MSKQKVEANKERKKNYKKYAKKEKRNKILSFIPLFVVIAVLLGFVVYSGIVKYNEYKEENPTLNEININPITDYISDLQGDSI